MHEPFILTFKLIINFKTFTSKSSRKCDIVQPCRHFQIHSLFSEEWDKPNSLTTRKYKAAGTTGLLFDFTTVSHKTFLENPSTAP